MTHPTQTTLDLALKLRKKYPNQPLEPHSGYRIHPELIVPNGNSWSIKIEPSYHFYSRKIFKEEAEYYAAVFAMVHQDFIDQWKEALATKTAYLNDTTTLYNAQNEAYQLSQRMEEEKKTTRTSVAKNRIRLPTDHKTH